MANHIGQAPGSGAGGMASELAIGLAMAKQISDSLGTAAPAGTPGAAPTAAASAAPNFDLLSPADAAKMLGVSEADVLQSISAGDLKAKKIGATYRIARAALEEFLK